MAHIESNFESCGYQQAHCPLHSGYCRSKRFSLLLKSLLFPCPVKADEQMLRFFMENKLKPRVEDVIQTMRNSGLQDKRYNSVHTFAKLFSPDYEVKRIQHVFHLEKSLLFSFKEFENKFFRMFKTHLSYSLVLDYLLRGTAIEFLLQFVKTTKCKRRLKTYRKRIKQLNSRV